MDVRLTQVGYWKIGQPSGYCKVFEAFMNVISLSLLLTSETLAEKKTIFKALAALCSTKLRFREEQLKVLEHVHDLLRTLPDLHDLQGAKGKQFVEETLGP